METLIPPQNLLTHFNQMYTFWQSPSAGHRTNENNCVLEWIGGNLERNSNMGHFIQIIYNEYEIGKCHVFCGIWCQMELDSINFLSVFTCSLGFIIKIVLVRLIYLVMHIWC